MKYAILGLDNVILGIRNTKPSSEFIDEYFEVTDEQGEMVFSSDSRWFIHEGNLIDADEMGKISRRENLSKKLTENYSNNIERGKEFLRKHFSNVRYRKETGGIEVNGIFIRTDRFTVDRVYQARALAKEDDNFNVDWKLSNGNFVNLDAATIINIADAVTQHIKESFSKEKVINDLIESAETLEDLKSIEW